jgi:hypothetical protein
MIRFYFTAIFFGLLVGSILPSYASAVYDPGLGRFCSRDPVGYIDGTNRYGAHFAPSELDPSGLFTLTYKNTAGGEPQAKSDCGGATWNILFYLKRGKGDSKAAGILVQKVEQAPAVKRCACGSEADFPKNDPKWPYKHKMPFWEFFESDSDKDVSFPEKKDVTGQVVDDLVTTPDFGPDTKGTIVVTLNACFQVGKKKPKVFKDPPKGHPGGQPYTESDPNLGKCDATLDRKLTVTWNCCKDDGEKQFKTKVESSPK